LLEYQNFLQHCLSWFST